MSRNNLSVVAFRRKREGKTHYSKRVKLLMSRKPRLIIRKSLKSTIVQIAEYTITGDKIKITATSNELSKEGWQYSTSNLPAAYLTGLLAGKKMKEAGIKEAVLDIGRQTNITKGRVFACLKGVVDAGINIPHSPEAFPSEDRLMGKHIEGYAITNQYASKFQYSKHTQNNVDPKAISQAVTNMKNKLQGKTK